MALIIGTAGRPNAGKGTLIGQLKDWWERGEVYHISIGDLVKSDAELKEIANGGELIKPDIDFAKVQDKLKSLNPQKGDIVIIDSLRTIEDWDSFKEILDTFLLFDISKEEAMRRSAERVFCPKCSEAYTKTSDFKKPKVSGRCDKCGSKLIVRKDDQPDVAKRRQDDFDKITCPMIAKIKKEATVPIIKVRVDGDTVLSDNLIGVLISHLGES